VAGIDLSSSCYYSTRYILLSLA